MSFQEGTRGETPRKESENLTAQAAENNTQEGSNITRFIAFLASTLGCGLFIVCPVTGAASCAGRRWQVTVHLLKSRHGDADRRAEGTDRRSQEGPAPWWEIRRTEPGRSFPSSRLRKWPGRGHPGSMDKLRSICTQGPRCLAVWSWARSLTTLLQVPGEGVSYSRVVGTS